MNKQDEPTEAQPCKALTGLWELYGTYVSVTLYYITLYLSTYKKAPRVIGA